MTTEEKKQFLQLLRAVTDGYFACGEFDLTNGGYTDLWNRTKQQEKLLTAFVFSFGDQRTTQPQRTHEA